MLCSTTLFSSGVNVAKMPALLLSIWISTTSMIRFTRLDFNNAPKTLLRNGRLANARVWRVELNGKTWTVKDFSDRPWYIRNTIGRFLLRREVYFLNRLEGVEGISQNAFRMDAFAMAVEFTEGTGLAQVPETQITPEFLCQFEALLKRIHARDVVHLDCRGMGNILYRPDGTPALIDFQSGMDTRRLPRFLGRILKDIDISGVLKRWQAVHPELMGQARLDELERIERWRRLWAFKGYFGIDKNAPKKRR